MTGRIPCWVCGERFDSVAPDNIYCRRACKETSAVHRRLARLGLREEPTPHPKWEAWQAGLAERASEKERLAREAAEKAAVAEASRLAACPRRDKQAWGTREATEQVIALMRQAGRPGAADLHPYLCACGAWHAGSRSKYERALARAEEAS